MWGIIPAAGKGSRIQPLAFSKELLPMAARDHENRVHTRAVSDYLVERLVLGGATRLCFVISPLKSDILEYYGGCAHSASVCYAVQPSPEGLCDAIFRALPFIDAGAHVLVGLPDTIWYPADALYHLPDNELSFLLFPVERPEHFDAVVLDDFDRVTAIQVKQKSASSCWIWGAFKLPATLLRELFDLWVERNRSDEYIGTLVNAWIARGGVARGVRGGSSYMDVGSIAGYLQTIQVLERESVEAGGAR